MAEAIQLHSRVGADGVLDLHIPMGDVEAGAEVLVTIRRLAPQPARGSLTPEQWHQFVEETYGSCAGLGLERPPQGTFEDREPIE